jgi:hypothetical protein
MDPSDPVDEFLREGISVPYDVPFRDVLLRQTSRVLWRRRWRRRLVHAGAIAASFLLGAACMQLWSPATPAERPAAIHSQAQAPAPTVQPKEQTPEVALGIAAVVKEWKAFDDRKQQRELYRQAGDLYFYTNQDYESALRCYTQALDAASDQDLAVSPDDNWLLIALKEARLKEKNDARNDG